MIEEEKVSSLVYPIGLDFLHFCYTYFGSEPLVILVQSTCHIKPLLRKWFLCYNRLRWTNGPVVLVASTLPLTSRGTGPIPVWSTTKGNLCIEVVFISKNVVLWQHSMLQRIINSKSKTFLAFCGSFLLGIVGMTLVQAIFFDGFKQIRSLVVYGAVSLLAAVVMIALFWKDKGARFWAVLWFCFLFGIVRYISVFPAQNNISTQNEKSMTLTGYVAVDPDVRIDGVRYIVQIINQPLTGRTYVKSNLYPRYKYGDVLKLGCDLTSPEPIEDFRYDMYLAKLGVSLSARIQRFKKLTKEEIFSCEKFWE